MNKKLFANGASLAGLSIFGAIFALIIMLIAPTIGIIILIFDGIMFLAGILFIIIAFVQEGPKEEKPKSKESALDILKKRFAEGKINKKEFEEKKKVLK